MNTKTKKDNGWIKIGDEVPELNQDCLSLDKYGGVYVTKYEVGIFQYKPSVGLPYTHHCVTHWMPRPKLPQNKI